MVTSRAAQHNTAEHNTQHSAMECSRCRSRHAAHGHTRETRPEPLRARGRGRDRAQVVREGVSKWTFPSRPSFRPLLVAPTSASSVRWSPGNSWDLQIQHSIPDMEDVVSDELRQRIERVLTFPIGRSEGEELANDSCSTNGPAAHTRAATGGLLQDYLDQLHPELGEGEAEEDEDEDEDELLFQGPEGGEESEADLLYDPEKEQYTTTYLLFLQQLRVGRRSAKHEPEPCPDDLLAPRTQKTKEEKKFEDDDDEEEEEEEEEGRASMGREGAVGRSGHRSSIVTSSRTPQTLASVSAESVESKSKNRHPETSNSSEMENGARGTLNSHPPASNSHEVEEGEVETEEHHEEEEGEEEGRHKTRDEKRRRRQKKKKKKKTKKTKGKGNGTEEEDEREGQKDENGERKGKKEKGEQEADNLAALENSTALALFREFAKTVFAPKHPQFKLFPSLEAPHDTPALTPGPTPPTPRKGTTERL